MNVGPKRGRPAKRERIEELIAVDLRKLKRSGQLASGGLSVLDRGAWAVWAESGRLVLHTLDGSRPPMVARLDQEPCRFGGCRTWLLCPSCSGRAMVLYITSASPNLACRRCCGPLSYPSQRGIRSAVEQPAGVAPTRQFAPNKSAATFLRELFAVDLGY